MGLLYRPSHPFADKDGFVSREDFEYVEAMRTDHLHMTDGNKKVYIQYIPDEMPPTRHLARPDKRMYTSKKKFRDETRARGCIEVGNDTAALFNRKPIKLSKKDRVEDIKRAIEYHKSLQTPRERRRRFYRPK